MLLLLLKDRACFKVVLLSKMEHVSLFVLSLLLAVSK